MDELEAAMEQYKKKQEQLDAQLESAKLSVDQNNEALSTFVVTVAHPTLEEIGNRLVAKGHKFAVEMTNERRGIKFNVFLGGVGHVEYLSSPQFPGSHPYVSFYPVGTTRMVQVLVRTKKGGKYEEGKLGEARDVSEFTHDEVRKIVLEQVIAALNG